MTLEVIEALIIIFLIMAYFGQAIRHRAIMMEAKKCIDECSGITKKIIDEKHKHQDQMKHLQAVIEDLELKKAFSEQKHKAWKPYTEHLRTLLGKVAECDYALGYLDANVIQQILDVTGGNHEKH